MSGITRPIFQVGCIPAAAKANHLEQFMELKDKDDAYYKPPAREDDVKIPPQSIIFVDENKSRSSVQQAPPVFASWAGRGAAPKKGKDTIETSLNDQLALRKTERQGLYFGVGRTDTLGFGKNGLSVTVRGLTEVVHSGLALVHAGRHLEYYLPNQNLSNITPHATLPQVPVGIREVDAASLVDHGYFMRNCLLSKDSTTSKYLDLIAQEVAQTQAITTRNGTAQDPYDADLSEAFYMRDFILRTMWMGAKMYAEKHAADNRAATITQFANELGLAATGAGVHGTFVNEALSHAVAPADTYNDTPAFKNGFPYTLDSTERNAFLNNQQTAFMRMVMAIRMQRDAELNRRIGFCVQSAAPGEQVRFLVGSGR